jgi:hypothetical protein
MPTRIEEIISEAKRLQEDSLYSYKGHLEAARLSKFIHYGLGLPSVVLAALVGLSMNNPTLSPWVGFIAIIITIFTALSTFINPFRAAEQHRIIGEKYGALYREARRFVNLECNDASSIDELQKRLDDLATKQDQYNAEGPQITRIPYLLAKRNIEQNKEAENAVDKEQDKNRS